MFYHPETQTYIREGVGFELAGVQYPANWLNLSTPDEKLILGLREVVTVGERADERTHFINEELVDGELRVINTPKPPEMLAALEASDIATELAKFRAVREQVIDRLMGIAGRAARRSDTALAAACDTAAEGLLDLTADLPSTLAEVRETVALRYAGIAVAALTAAPSLESAFAKIDA